MAQRFQIQASHLRRRRFFWGMSFFLLTQLWGAQASWAAHPALQEAQAQVASGDTEGLFLKYGAATPEDMSASDKKALSELLVQGAQKARGDDFIAHGLLSRALALHETADTLLAMSEVEVRLGQKGGASERLRQGVDRFPQRGDLSLALGKLLMEDEDFLGAQKSFEQAVALKVPQAQEWLKKAQDKARAQQKADADFQRNEQELKAKLEVARRSAVRDWLDKIAQASARDDFVVGGKRQAQTAHFYFTYTAEKKTMAEVHNFDGRIQKIIEFAYDFVSQALSHEMDRKIPVALLTQEEFLERYGAVHGQSVSGFWNGQQIVLNGHTSVDEQFAVLMVHELTHAFIQSMVGQRAAVPIWINEGLAQYVDRCASKSGCGPTPEDKRIFAQFLRIPGHPGLEGLSQGFRSVGSPEFRISYAVALVATHHLVEKKGMKALRATLREMRAIRNPQLFDRALKKHLNLTTKDVEKSLGI